MTERKHDDSLKQYLVDEFIQDYQQGQMSRRDALKLLKGLVGASAAAALIAACAPAATPTSAVQPTAMSPAPTLAPTVAATTVSATNPPPETTAASPSADPTITTTATETVMPNTNNVPVSADDPAIQARDISFPSQGAEVMGYLARPAGNGTYPAILVAHENRGLTDHIKDVTRRLAKAGYVALAVDLLSRKGGTAQVGSSNVPGVLGNTPPAQMVADFATALEYLEQQNFVAPGQFGMIGFCFGGGMTWRAATQLPELKAAVPYYGPNPPLEDVPKINAAVLAQYGGNDSRINSGIPAMEKAMKENHKIFEYMIYDGANHAFNNDTSGNYNAQAANQAWAKTLEWFEQHVRG